MPVRAIDDMVLEIIGEIGKHPELIKTAIEESNTMKDKSLRPLKSKQAQLQRRHSELTAELQRFMQLANRPGNDHLGREAMAAAEETSRSKHEVERELEKVKIEIEYRERVVTDEQRIADTFQAFGNQINELSETDQIDLLRRVVRKARVNRLDPKKASIPPGPHTWNTQLRTQWYSVNLEFYATDLVSRVTKKGYREFVFAWYWRRDRDSPFYSVAC